MTRLLRVEGRRESNADQVGGDLVIEVSGRWIRFAAYFGVPPGSRIGLWRTRFDDMRGVNLRIGKRYRKTLTVFVHTRPRRTSRLVEVSEPGEDAT